MRNGSEREVYIVKSPYRGNARINRVQGPRLHAIDFADEHAERGAIFADAKTHGDADADTYT